MTDNDERRLLWWYAYPAPPSVLNRGGGKGRYANLGDSLHMLRDGATCLHVFGIVADSHTFGGILLNLPPGVYAEEGPRLDDDPSLDSRDLLVLPTRPPLDDDLGRRPMVRSGSRLECDVIDSLRLFFKHCSRSCVILSNEVAECIEDPDKRNCRAVQYRVTGGQAVYVHCGDVDERVDLEKHPPRVPNTTAGYAAYVPHVRRNRSANGPALLALFGPDGTSTLLWSHLVFTRFDDLLREMIAGDKPRIVMGEFSPSFPRSVRPTMLRSEFLRHAAIVVDVTLS